MLLALVAAGCGDSAERAGEPAGTATPAATAAPDLEKVLANDPAFKDRRVRACLLGRLDEAARADLAAGLERGDVPSQERLMELSDRCRARAGVALGVTQDVIAESGADVKCALRRLRASLSPRQREKAAEGDLDAETSRAVAAAVAACK